MSSPLGKKVIDLTDAIAMFEAQEGEVEQIIGKTGQGKTYEATRRAAKFLFQGYTVYTTWRLHLPEYYDEREHLWPIIRNIFTFRRDFFRFDLKHNWHYVDLRDYEDADGVFDTERFSKFLAGITDAIFMLDEGQDVFDSHTRAGKIARQAITRTRHMHKTLIIISQRAQAVDVTARGNVTTFYRCEKRYIPLFGHRFKVYRTDDIDEGSNYPIWVRHDSTGREVWKAPVYHSAFGKKWIYDMYDSWYMRQEQIRSQDIKLEAYSLTSLDRIRTLGRFFFRSKKPIDTEKHAIIKPYVEREKSPETEQRVAVSVRYPRSTEGVTPRQTISRDIRTPMM